jgi:hypothetical protein
MTRYNIKLASLIPWEVESMAEFTEREKEVLAEFLDEAISGLRTEIAASDREEYRDMLRERKETLKNILAKLG